MQASEVLANEIVGGAIHNGWPDFFLGTVEGHPVVMEIKLGDTQQLKENQKQMRDVLVDHGFVYFLMRVYPDQTFKIFRWDPSVKKVIGLQSPPPWIPVSFKEFSLVHKRAKSKFLDLDRHSSRLGEPIRCSACGWTAGLNSPRVIKTAEGTSWQFCPNCGERIYHEEEAAAELVVPREGSITVISALDRQERESEVPKGMNGSEGTGSSSQEDSK
jgi:predicted RNA-binding Zn-ribbon protein involved in translation (DUF1610 family)